MELFKEKRYKLLEKSIILVLFFLITFFTFNNPSKAASFKYSEFDFDKFAEKNLGYWTRNCSQKYDTENEQKKCTEKVLESQRSFYTRLYKLLAKFEKYGHIDDKIIITTTFFELDPEMFADTSDRYQAVTNSSGTSYNADTDDINTYDIDKPEGKDYFEKETDTLKLLINTMIGYKSYCYGIFGTKTVKDEFGNDQNVCLDGKYTTFSSGTKCAELKTTDTIGFWDKFGGLFGIKSEAEQNCLNEIATNSSYIDHEFYSEKTKSVNEDKYWEFLEKGRYFDRKAHLQYRFAKIYNKINPEYKSMSDLSEPEYEEYNEEIIAVRQRIIKEIKGILKNYGEEANILDYQNASSNKMWWPIGSSETTSTNGKTYASGDPASVSYSSLYGMRLHPIHHDYRMHNGVDLTGTGAAGTDNIIAAKDGIVVDVTNICESYGDSSCGGGYGNYIKISHSDGTYTLYAHLHQNTITVTENESVRQGEVIGKMGSSGASTGPHLHFEVWTDANNRTDPFNYIDANNPRPSGAGLLEEFVSSMEGTGPTSGNDYLVYCNSGDIPTVGHGITLQYNIEYFSKYGINASALTCGSAVSKEVADSIYYERMNADKETVRSLLSSLGITLAETQIDALTSLKFNHGNIDGFSSAYSTYGNTSALCTNWWNEYAVMSGSAFEQGLRTRRQKECNLFVTGNYS